jgi:hypothetical protein
LLFVENLDRICWTLSQNPWDKPSACPNHCPYLLSSHFPSLYMTQHVDLWRYKTFIEAIVNHLTSRNDETRDARSNLWLF